MVLTTGSLTAAIDLDEGRSISNGGSISEKPHLVFTAATATGHTLPLLQIAGEMVKRGYEASFIGGPQYTEQLKRMGVMTHVAVPDMMTQAFQDARNKVSPGLPRMLHDMKHGFADYIPVRFAALRDHLEAIRAARPERQVVIVNETLFLGALPFLKGVPPPKGFASFPRVIDINIVPYNMDSIDTAPFGPGLPPDSTPSGRARNVLLNKLMATAIFGDVTAYQSKLLLGLGATHDTDEPPCQLWSGSYEVILQMCPPSFEYPRSDLHPAVRFGGALPPKPLPQGFEPPEWWARLDGKKVVVVSQGTVATQYDELLIPTLHALAGRDDLLVVAILCVRGAALPAADVPANAVVVDYFPYDAILPRADVFVQNAGYGGVLHSMVHGVPLVVAGETEDKAETATRIEWSGIGLNLRTARPTVEQLRDGVAELLANPKYKDAVMRMKLENDAMDPFGAVEEQIRRFTE